MMRLIKAWQTGVRVLFRCFWFSFILGILMTPFLLVIRYFAQGEDSLAATRPAGEPLVLIGLILVVPLLFFLASKMTSEFVAPPITRKNFQRLAASWPEAPRKRADSPAEW